MALEGNEPRGDDQKWKSQVEKDIKELKKEVAELRSLVNYLRKLRG